jgi:lactate dehydrogenase-like 2-hydroxyacid dehydrogenase
MLAPIVIATALPQTAIDEAHKHFGVRLELTTDPDQIWAAAAESQAVGVVISGQIKIRSHALDNVPRSVKIIATASVGFDTSTFKPPRRSA